MGKSQRPGQLVTLPVAPLVSPGPPGPLGCGRLTLGVGLNWALQLDVRALGSQKRRGAAALSDSTYQQCAIGQPQGGSPRRQALSNWFVELNWVRLDHFPGPSAANGEEPPCCGIPEEASRHPCTVQPANSSDVWGTNPKPGTGSSGFPSRQSPALPVGDRPRPRAHITFPPPARPPVALK